MTLEYKPVDRPVLQRDVQQAGMVMSFALLLAVAAASLPRDVMLQLFVGTNVQLGSAVTRAFVVGMHSAFLVSIALCVLGAIFSVVRGKEIRPTRVEA